MRSCLACALIAFLGGCGRIGFDSLDTADAGPRLTMPLTVPCAANLWGAGHATAPADAPGGEGILPPSIALPAGSGRVLSVTAAAGIISFTGGIDSNDADGISATALASWTYGGLSAPSLPRQRFLAAVVLDDAEPVDPAPLALPMDANAPGASVGIGQMFFVGDGVTGTATGTTQAFRLPDTGTRLFLGFLDSNGGIGSTPGGYNDNTGEVTGTLSVL